MQTNKKKYVSVKIPAQSTQCSAQSCKRRYLEPLGYMWEKCHCLPITQSCFYWGIQEHSMSILVTLSAKARLAVCTRGVSLRAALPIGAQKRGRGSHKVAPLSPTEPESRTSFKRCHLLKVNKILKNLWQGASVVTAWLKKALNSSHVKPRHT